LFKKYFGETDQLPQDGFFVNNANAALAKHIWQDQPFDEEVTGLEDMDLAKRLVAQGERIGYVANAGVYHLHDETWRQVKWRYEREAIALQRIMPEVQVHAVDAIRYATSGMFLDMGAALQEGRFHKEAIDIMRFRTMQYFGAFRGNHEHRKLSRQQKEHYFYPR